MAVAKTTDGGSNWSYSELTSQRGAVYALAVDPSNSNTVYAGGYVYDNAYKGKIFKSTNSGGQWSDISTAVFNDYNYIYSIAVDPDNAAHLLAGANYGLYRSSNGGASWSEIGNFNEVRGIVFDPQGANTIYIATGNGVYSSTNNGSTWQAHNENLTTLEMQCLCLDSQNRYLFSGSKNGGAFRLSVPTAIEPDNHSPAANGFKLHANYPNPFNPTTHIRFTLPAGVSDNVNISVYDVAGKLVKVLYDTPSRPGEQTIQWHGKDDNGQPVASGIYVCVLTSGRIRLSQKMILLR